MFDVGGQNQLASSRRFLPQSAPGTPFRFRSVVGEYAAEEDDVGSESRYLSGLGVVEDSSTLSVSTWSRTAVFMSRLLSTGPGLPVGAEQNQRELILQRMKLGVVVRCLGAINAAEQPGLPGSRLVFGESPCRKGWSKG